MSKKIITYFGVLILFILFITPVFIWAQSEPTEGPSEEGGGQAPVEQCVLDSDCGPGLVCSKGECYKAIPPTEPITPTELIVPTEGPSEEGGGLFILEPINGECPKEYLVSVDKTECVKLFSPTIEVLPSVGPTDEGGGQVPSVQCDLDSDCGLGLVCIKGECYKSAPPTEFVEPTDEGGGQVPSVQCDLDSDCGSGLVCVNGDCYKAVSPVPTIFISPEENFKEIIIEPKKEVIIKDRNTKKEAIISPKEGFRIVVSVESEENDLTEVPQEAITKKITIQYRIDSDQIIMSVGKFLITTKELISVKENKIFLKQKEIKIMPDVASEIAIEKLGGLDFKIELKDVGKQGIVQPVYEAVIIKDVKIFGLFKVKMELRIDIDAIMGEASKVKKPWWSFLTR